jgi:hypothetical protein
MKLIESKTLGTAQASIEFTSIPQDATDLVALVSTRGSRTGANIDAIQVRFNGTTSGYSERMLYGDGSTAASLSGSGTSFLYSVYSTSNSITSNTFSSGQMYIPNYTGSTNKSISVDSVTENNATNNLMNIQAGLWSNTAAITSILFTSDTAGGFLAGSTISLYKITKGSDGIVTTS